MKFKIYYEDDEDDLRVIKTMSDGDVQTIIKIQVPSRAALQDVKEYMQRQNIKFKIKKVTGKLTYVISFNEEYHTKVTNMMSWEKIEIISHHQSRHT